LKIIQTIIPLDKTLQINNTLVCKRCKESINNRKVKNVILLRKPIFNENIIPFVKILNKLKEHLIALQMAFAYIFQLNDWGQYDIRGSVINVPTNLDKIQTILPQPTTCESTMALCIKRKLEFKFPYCQVMLDLNL
jgi:hypothetical protein